MVSAAKPKHLFICGCPRSGTTLVAELMNAHSRVAIGIERYGNRFFAEPLTPGLFERTRFYDIQQGDTFYTSLDFSPDYARKHESFDSMAYVGDKIPMLYRYFGSLRDNFADAKVIFCVRNIFDVASSFQLRSDNPEDTSWSEGLDGLAAVNHWNSSLAAYLAYRRSLDIYVFHQDRFAQEGDKQAREILNWLDLEADDSFTWLLERKIVYAERLLTKRELRLTEKVKAKISMEANFDAYRRTIRQSRGKRLA